MIRAKEGATIAVNDINAENAEQTAKEVKELGQESIVLVADVTSTSPVLSTTMSPTAILPVIDFAKAFSVWLFPFLIDLVV